MMQGFSYRRGFQPADKVLLHWRYFLPFLKQFWLILEFWSQFPRVWRSFAVKAKTV